jgi:hypothetical protein
MIVVATLLPWIAYAEPQRIVTAVTPADESSDGRPRTDPGSAAATDPRTDTSSGELALPWRNYVFERESRALAKMVNIAPWEAARLLAEDPAVRGRASAALDARDSRTRLGTGLLIGGLVLTLVGVALTAISGEIRANESSSFEGPSTAINKAFGTGIGLLSVGIVLDSTAIGALTGLTDEERGFRSWFKNR